MEFPQVSLDKENNIEYQIGLCSVEYCVFLLITLIEKSKQQNKRRVILPTKFRRGYPYQIDNENDEKELDWKDILIRNMREFSIKIITPNYSSLEKNRKRKECYVFEFIY